MRVGLPDGDGNNYYAKVVDSVADDMYKHGEQSQIPTNLGRLESVMAVLQMTAKRL